MTGMEHAIEKAARVIQQARDAGAVYDDAGEPLSAAETIARALADAGLLAPAPLREEWGSEMRNARPESSSHVLYARDRDNAQWQIEHNPEWATGRIVRRFVTDWEET